MKSNIGKLIETLYKGVVNNFARLIFRDINGKSVASDRVRKPITRDPITRSKPLKKNSGTFKDAVAYARKKSVDPDYQEQAALRYTSAYNVALADYLNPPLIYDIDAKDYEGLPGSDIFIEATDDFQVESVKVKIMDGSGQLVEEGEARCERGFDWCYTTTAVNKNFLGSIIATTAYDKPGNFGLFAIREDGTNATVDAYSSSVTP